MQRTLTKTQKNKAYKPKSLKIVFFCLLAVFFMQAQGFSQKKTITIATLAPKSSSWGQLMRSLVRDVYKQSDKQLLLRVYYGGGQGDEAEMKDKVQLQQLDAGFFTGNGLGAFSKEIRLLELPGVINTYSEAQIIYQQMVDDFNPYFQKKGFELIALTQVGFAYFYSQQPIPSIASIRETKMWLWKGDRFAKDMMAAFKIPAISISLTEVLPSLQTGLLDGVYATPTALISLEWHKQVRYSLDLPLTLVSSGFVMGKRSYDALAPAHKKLLKTSARAIFASFSEKIKEQDKEARQILEQTGMQFLAPKDSLNSLTKIIEQSQLRQNFPAKLSAKIDILLNKN